MVPTKMKSYGEETKEVVITTRNHKNFPPSLYGNGYMNRRRIWSIYSLWPMDTPSMTQPADTMPTILMLDAIPVWANTSFYNGSTISEKSSNNQHQ